MTSSALANQKLKQNKTKQKTKGIFGAVHLYIPVLKWDKQHSQRCKKGSEKTAVFILFTHKEEKAYLIEGRYSALIHYICPAA